MVPSSRQVVGLNMWVLHLGVVISQYILLVAICGHEDNSPLPAHTGLAEAWRKWGYLLGSGGHAQGILRVLEFHDKQLMIDAEI